MKKINMAGKWKFFMDFGKKVQEGNQSEDMFTEEINLPATVATAKKGIRNNEVSEGCLSDEYSFSGRTWYQREVLLVKGENKRYELVLERTRVSKVWFNGVLLGSCNSLCTLHRYELTQYLKMKNTITIMIDNSEYPVTGGHMTSPDTQTNWNGIVGELYIEEHGVNYITDVKIYPDAVHKKIKICLNLRGQEKCNACIMLEEGQSVFPKTFFALEPGINNIDYFLEETPKVWSEFTPVLYQLKIQLFEPEQLKYDNYSYQIGFRDLKTVERFFYLNGSRIFLRGKHDGMVFPMTGHAPMDEDSWIKVFEIAKQYGINHYRFHTCCPPEAAFRAADRMGIYLEPELPFWGTITTSEDENHNETAQQYLIQEGFRILDEFGNHPSFMFMSLGNELWGSGEKLNEILGLYKEYDTRHLYTQGSNNFQFMPKVLENDDFFCGVRFSKNRLIRGSYAMCDAPLGQIQMKRPGSQHDYDAFICQAEASFREEVSDTKDIQYGTGMKTVKMDIANELICKVPVVTHEIGQYAMYPHLSEIEKYTGVLKPKNLEKLKMVLQDKNLFKMAESFFRSSGLLSVDCYKVELETALASNELSGFQILDLQDFPGQGMAFVGILDSLMKSKGLITPEDWRNFCSSRVLLARLPKFVFTSLEEVTIGIKYSQFYPTNLINPRIQIQIVDNQGVIFHEVVEAKGTYGNGVHALGEITVKFPEIKNPQKLILTVSMVNTTVANHYDLWLFPNNQKMVISNDIVITEDFTKMWDAIRSGKKVLFYPDNLNEKNSIEGTYCTDFWCYPMFRSISESMGKPVPVGTCGLMIDEQSPVFRYFPTKEYTTPQWYEVITKSRPLILDHYQVEPLVWMIDNFERNHQLGLLLEMKVGEGKLFISACNLSRIIDDCCSKWLEYSILKYMESEEFLPLTETSQEELLALFGN